MSAFHNALGNDNCAFIEADTDNNHYISIEEAFDYAVTKTDDTPQEAGNINLSDFTYLGEYRWF
ncbi:MAG: hypothetical protein Q7J68_07835, partial [Thermoplasmata archaeon]|nr:hypothetical protein [Thermoplasmata archaeon]